MCVVTVIISTYINMSLDTYCRFFHRYEKLLSSIILVIVAMTFGIAVIGQAVPEFVFQYLIRPGTIVQA